MIVYPHGQWLIIFQKLRGYHSLSSVLLDESPDTQVKHGRSRAVRTGGHEARLGVLVGEKSLIFGAWRIWGLLIALKELEVCNTSWRVLGDLWLAWGFFNLEEETVVCWCISVGKDAATYRILCGENNSTLLPSILKGSCILTTINISPAQQVTIRQRGRWFFRFRNMVHVHSVRVSHSVWTKMDDPNSSRNASRL